MLAACSGPLSTLDPAGPQAWVIARLWWVMLGGAGLLFALVMGLFALVMLRPGAGARVSTRRWILWGGIAMPLPVLLALLIFALIEGEYLMRPPPGEQPYRVEAHARQWEWAFAYPDSPGMEPTTDLMHIPAGRLVEVTLTSEDVIHAFWAPRLGGKIDAIPGRVTSLRLMADEAGEYGGLCAEYCGIGHTGMRFSIVAHAPDAFGALTEAGE